MAGLEKEIVEKELKGMVTKAKEAVMSEPEKAKAKEAKTAAEAVAKRDAEILSSSDDDLKDPKKFTDEERAKRPELAEKQRKDAEEAEKNLSADEKLKRVKDASQKRIDELTNDLKQVKDKSSKEAEDLRKKIEVLEKGKVEPKKDDLTSEITKEANERIVKYIEEDKDKPREQRREMSEEELDEWQLEEPVKFQRWLNQNETRRAVEIRKIAQEKGIQKLFDKQHESALRTYIKYPELDTRELEKELIAQGKSKEDIWNIMIEKNEKFRIASEILKEHPDWLGYEDLPERVVAEMEKRIANPPSDKASNEALLEKIEALEAKIARIESGDEGITSTITGNERKVAASEAEKEMVQAMRDMKATQAMIDSAVKKFRAKRGISA